MALSDLFKTKEQKAKEREIAQKKALRRVDRDLRNQQRQTSDLEKERKDLFDKVVAYRKAGDRASAEREAKIVATYDNMISNNKIKYLAAKSKIVKLKGANIATKVWEGIKDAAVLLDLNIDKLADNIEAAQEAEDQITEVDEEIIRVHEDEMHNTDIDYTKILEEADEVIIEHHLDKNEVKEDVEIDTDKIAKGRKRTEDLMKEIVK